MASSSQLFNYEFTDEDEQMLLGFATLPADRKPYRCGWLVPGGVCNAVLPGDSFPVHLRECHGIFGNDKARFRCEWVECGLQMNKESIVRHVTESHLQYKHQCTFCGEVFSRKHTLNGHLWKRHNFKAD